jgi:hypothetical protein
MNQENTTIKHRVIMIKITFKRTFIHTFIYTFILYINLRTNT